MADYPALPLWTDRYFADTRHLSRDEHGAYLLLLMEAWRRPRCSLPDDDVLLARLTCSTPDEWAALKSTVMAFWSLDGRSKEWTQKALSKERDFLSNQRKSQKGRIAKRWNNKEKADTGAIPERYPADTPTPTPTVSTDTFANAKASAVEVKTEPPPTAKPVTKKEQGGGSAEDRFWAMAGPAGDRGIARSTLAQLARVLNGDFERGVGIVTDAMAAKGPRPYLAKIIQNLKAEATPSLPLASPDVPQWAAEARGQGYPVQREGRYWRMAGALYDDGGEQVGN